eukprot:7014957-Alexandrium_andersonii.AAC.1
MQQRKQSLEFRVYIALTALPTLVYTCPCCALVFATWQALRLLGRLAIAHLRLDLIIISRSGAVSLLGPVVWGILWPWGASELATC